MSTRAQLVTAVRSNIEESTASYYTDAEIHEWLDQAQLDLVRNHIQHGKLTALHSTQAGTGTTLTLPSDFIAPVSLVVDSEDVPIVTREHPLADLGRPSASLDSFGILFGSSSLTLNVSATAATLYYIARPTAVASLASDATAPEIPADYHPAMILYATHMALKKDKYGETADSYLKRYYESVAAASGGNDDGN